MIEVDLLVTNIGELCRMGEGTGPLGGSAQGNVDAIPRAALAVRRGQIVAAGPEAAILGAYQAHETYSAEGGVVLPGWVDAHTHLLFATTRENEFAMRIEGKSYQEIAAAGGGIHSSVRHFRESDDASILRRSRRYLKQALALGTTTIEIKSGYGLNEEQELRALDLIQKLKEETPQEVVATYLGAHEIPKDVQREAFIEDILDTLEKVAAGRKAEFCDVFCEEGVFTPEESERILVKAREVGLKLKLHADEFGDTGGSKLAVKLQAVSADHLHGTPPERAKQLAAAGVVGVLLPGTSFFLNLDHKAPARSFVNQGLPIAVASDFNPGSSMSQSMPLMVSLACVQLRLTPAEALVAATVNGAAAIGREGSKGRLHPGFDADFQVLDLDNHQQIPYHYGVSHVREVFVGGEPISAQS
ncbi:MAG: imidazolonepropionase [Candidatus Eisenbacteria bacterium]|uniref:Imidazolonepropionase n=1 Tax=Eiseniibacteriota bacterium TaxID=2212470 RepID=A0A7Y2H2M4_UNCEI|nr:imidazolonepropionase [Candidatus Eisenbacteria bacterium]